MIHLSYPSLITEVNEPTVLAIGYFDGVHIGHQKVIQTANQMAKRLNHPLAVMTFHPHPKEVLKKKPMRYLTPISEKMNLLDQLGVKYAYLIQFDKNLARLTAKEFVEKVCVPLQVKGIVTGFNFRFGEKQAGSTRDLKILSQNRFETETVEAVIKDQTHVSSTWIRELLATGNLSLVTELLGRFYRFRGIVEHGDQRGRLIGFPTANLSLSSPFLLPKQGVYVVRASFEGRQAYGIMNIGVRPTFQQVSSREKIEVHLFYQEMNLYEKEMNVEVLHYLRAEQKFPSVDALIKQIHQDKYQAEKWLSTAQLFT